MRQTASKARGSEKQKRPWKPVHQFSSAVSGQKGDPIGDRRRVTRFEPYKRWYRYGVMGDRGCVLAADMQLRIERGEAFGKGLGRKEMLSADGCPWRAVCMDLRGCLENPTREF
jgi:hypothetical protein